MNKEHIKQTKYIQNEDGTHTMSIFIAGVWYCGYSLWETFQEMKNDLIFFWGTPENNPIMKYLCEQGIWIYLPSSNIPPIFGDNKDEIRKFERELESKILPVLISK